MSKRSSFYSASAQALSAITRVYEFIWPTAAALWNLRWQVAGYTQVRGEAATENELRARFIEGSGIHGTDLKKSCIKTSWENQQSELALVTLVNLIAVYENWVVEILAEINAIAPTGVAPEHALQHRTKQVKNNKQGIGAEIEQLLKAQSKAMATEIQPVLRDRKIVHPNHLDELITVYRFFKECRNCLMHQGGKATERTINAYTAMNALPSQPFLIPKQIHPQINQLVTLNLYSVVGFSEIIRSLIFTIDSLLSSTTAAESILIRRWRNKFGAIQTSADEIKRHSSIRGNLKQLGLPKLPAVVLIEQLLRNENLVR